MADLKWAGSGAYEPEPTREMILTDSTAHKSPTRREWTRNVNALQKLRDRAQKMAAEDWIELWVAQASGKSTRDATLPDFPAEEIQLLTNNQSGDATMRAASPFYRICLDQMSRYGVNPATEAMLDFGAGWGRIVRLLLREFGPDSIFAVDVDERLVDAGRTLLAPVSFELITAGGRLPFKDGQFSFIISNSVFSHLDRELHLH